jgi:hydrogenase-1 operon protein HyaF
MQKRSPRPPGDFTDEPEHLIQARPIPAGAVGPGTQPDEVDGAELTYLAMPGAMQTYRQPLLPEPEEVAGLTAGIWQLRALQHLLGGYCIGALPQVMDMRTLDAANLRLIEDSLGEGEVSIRCDDPAQAGLGRTTAQETRLAGVWRVRVIADDGRVERDVLEISDVPGFVRDAAFSGARSAIELRELAGRRHECPRRTGGTERVRRQAATGMTMRRRTSST